MKLLMNFNLVALTVLITSGIAFGGGHLKGWETVGTQFPISSETKEGESGSVLYVVSNDIWDYSNAPEGMPRVVKATCRNIIVNDSSGTLVGGQFICDSVDPNGDVQIYAGSLASDGSYDVNLTQGTGKYAEYVGVKLTGNFVGQVASGEGVYHVKPVE